jgi:hypothetical protein
MGIIGSGKSGQVYKVRSKISGMVYAAKVCNNVLILSLSDFFFDTKINKNP